MKIKTQPYPLNAFDRYFICHDYAEFSPNSHHVVASHKPFQKKILKSALHSLVQSEPGLRTRLRWGWTGIQRVALSPHEQARIPLPFFWDEPSEKGPGNKPDLDKPFDLFREPPFRLHHYRDSGEYRLVLTVHHSLVDGVGGLILLERLLKHYVSFSEKGVAADLPPLPAPSRYRHYFLAKGWVWLLRAMVRSFRPFEKHRVKNASLLDSNPPQEGPTAHYRIRIRPRLWENLRSVAREREVTRNDLLLGAALRAADRWRQWQGRAERPFQVMYPLDLRPLLNRPPSLQNFVSLLPLGLTPEQVRSPSLWRTLRRTVLDHRNLDQACKDPLNMGILAHLLPRALFRPLLRQYDRDPQTFYFSFLFSHVRLPASFVRPKDVEVKAVWLMGSIPRQPGIGLVVTSEPSGAQLLIEYRSGQISRDSVEIFGKILLREIEKQVPTGAPAPRPVARRSPLLARPWVDSPPPG